MSNATLLCWRFGHGVALETRSGLYEALVNAKGLDVRLVNSIPVDEWPDHSQTAKRVEDLFQLVRSELAEMNRLRGEPDADLPGQVAEYRTLYWAVRAKLKEA
jgi:hypothetical protein